MHGLVDLGHSVTHVVVCSCPDEARTSEHIGISPTEEGWTAANDNEMYLVSALTCNILQHRQFVVVEQTVVFHRAILCSTLY
jgi:hypothetical protein